MTLNGKKVLVTGADGFIGSHLTEMLVKNGAEVTALSQYNSFNFWGWLEDLSCLNDIRVVTGDVRDSNFCREITRGMDIVFHLAALIPIPYSYKAPDSYVDTNVKGTLNMCQAARDNGVGLLIPTSTSEVYGTAQYIPMDEKHPLAAQSPYSATKIGADAIAYSFWAAFNLPVIIARPFNVYGPRQSARAVIPSIITQLASGMRRIELGALDTTRDLTFVEDTCRGFLALAGLGEQHFGEVFHIGSNYQVSVRELFDKISGILGTDAEVVTTEERLRPAKSEVYKLHCDNRKLQAACGYAPSISIDEGLKRTCEWFRNPDNLRKYKGHLYNV
jgi:NAD dependent epimerase/dehydratase